MGELTHSYPEKTLGLSLRGNRLLPKYSIKAHNLADRYFREKNVQIHYNSEYKEHKAEYKNYDLVLHCTGYTYKTDYMK